MTPDEALRVFRTFAAASPRRADGYGAAALSLLLRAAVVVWAAPRFAPVEDGRFYHVVATRIAAGEGYTWLWPDGVVTYAAHYPVGYPAITGLLYAAFGPHPAAAMALNAVVGAAGVLAVHRLAATVANRGGALAGAVAAAVHPGLVFYTPALMTEGITGALLAVSAALLLGPLRPDADGAVAEPGSRTSGLRALLAGGLVLGVAALIRPQVAALAPLFALLGSARGAGQKLRAAAVVTAVVAAVSAPWVLRNCSRMHACTPSANGGWNLFIGAAPGATGTFVPIEALGVPPECRTVWGEAEKDACFGGAGRRAIAADPAAWLARIPAKLAYTFDYSGAAGWYLSTSNPGEFGQQAKVALGAAETVFQRLVVLFALVALARAGGPRGRARLVVAAAASLFLFVRGAWVAHVGLVVAALLLGRSLGREHPPALAAAGAVLGTAAFHAAFFGAGRYSLVCFPVLSALAGAAARRAAVGLPGASLLTPGKPAGDTESEKES